MNDLRLESHRSVQARGRVATALAILAGVQVAVGLALHVLAADIARWAAVAVHLAALAAVVVPLTWVLRRHKRTMRDVHSPQADLAGAHSRLRRGYAIVLGAFVVVILGGTWLVQGEIRKAAGRGALIENANRQQALSAQLYGAIVSVIAHSGITNDTLEQLTQIPLDLAATLDVMASNLADSDAASTALHAHLTQSRVDTERVAEVASRLVNAHSTSRLSGLDIAILANELIAIADMHQRSHVVSMDRVIRTLAAAADAQVRNIAQASLIASGLLLATLLVAVFLVLEPAARTLEAQTARIEESRKHADRLAEIARRTSDAVVITDRDFNIEWVNEGFCRLTGYAVHEVTGRDAERYIFGADTQPDAPARIRACRERGEPYHGEARCRDRHAQELIARVDVKPLRDASGRVSGFMSIQADITSERRMAAALCANEERWNMALQGSGDGVWDWDIAAGKLYRSASWMETLGYSDGELPDQRGFWHDMIHRDDVEATLTLLDEHLRGERTSYDCEHRMRCKDGSFKWVLSRGKVLRRDLDGRPLRMVGTQTDIAPRKALQEELRRHRDELQVLVDERTAELTAAMHDAHGARLMAERANRAKSMFLANMSHELRTPMHAILGFAKLGMGAKTPDESARTVEYFRRIEISGVRLLKLLDNLLDLSKLEAQQMNMRPAWVSCTQIVQAVADELAPLAERQGQRLDIDCGGVSDLVWIDPERIRQVLRNLVANAIKFTPPDRSIRVSAHTVRQSAGSSFEFSVTDEGIGIPPGELVSIFDEFVQSSKTVTGAGGTGLGLAICKRIVHAHGGTIDARNSDHGGACFTVRIPQPPRGMAAAA